MRYLWVVEMYIHGWEPTTSASLSRNDALTELAAMKRLNPDDEFRVVKYVRPK